MAALQCYECGIEHTAVDCNVETICLSTSVMQSCQLRHFEHAESPLFHVE